MSGSQGSARVGHRRVIAMCARQAPSARGGGNGDEAEIEAGSDEDVPGGSDPIVRALSRARGGGNGDEAEIEAGSDEDVPGGADPIVRAATTRSHSSRAKA